MKPFYHFNDSIPSLSSELLYTIIQDDNPESIIIEALSELQSRNELSEEVLNELNGIAGEPPLIKSPAQLTGPQAAALGVGLGAGYAAKKALNLTGSGADTNKSTGNIAKANINSPAKSGLSFKGDLPTMPKTSDNTKGMALTGKKFDPIKTALRGADTQSQPQVNKRMIGPMPGTKSEPVSQKQVLAKSTPDKTVTRSAVSKPSKPIDTTAKSSSRPVTSKSTTPIIPKTKTAEAPKPTKSIPKVSRPEADPNIGKGFVTAAVSKGPSGNLRTVNLSRGKADTTSMPSKLSSTKEPLQKARNQSYAKPADWKSSGTVKNLAPQGTAQRDTQLAKMGYKKF